MSKSYIKCQFCGTENVNNDYCGNCGRIINVVLERNLERQKVNDEKLAVRANQKPTKFEVFLKKGTDHSNIIIRAFFKVGLAIWYFFAAIIGAFIAAVVGAAAG